MGARNSNPGYTGPYNGLFQRIPGVIPDYEDSFSHGGGKALLWTNGADFVVTNTASITIAHDNVYGHPGMSFIGNGTATDGHNSVYAGEYFLTANRAIRMYHQFALTDLTASAQQEFNFGLLTSGSTTNSIGSKPADYILFEHLKADNDNTITLKALAAAHSNVAQTAKLNMSSTAVGACPVLNTTGWFDFECLIIPDGAGNATVDYWIGQALIWGSSAPNMIYGGRVNLVGSVPDSVALSPVRSVRQGSTSTSKKFYFGAWGFAQERV